MFIYPSVAKTIIPQKFDLAPGIHVLIMVAQGEGAYCMKTGHLLHEDRALIRDRELILNHCLPRHVEVPKLQTVIYIT